MVKVRTDLDGRALTPHIEPVPLPFLGYTPCQVCQGQAVVRICFSGPLRLVQRVGCAHCGVTGWCACERCHSSYGGQWRVDRWEDAAEEEMVGA